MRLAAHESVAGGAWNAVALGRSDGCEALPIFARPSARWRARPFAPDEVSRFRSELASVGWLSMSHGSYLINPCSARLRGLVGAARPDEPLPAHTPLPTRRRASPTRATRQTSFE